MAKSNRQPTGPATGKTAKKQAVKPSPKKITNKDVIRPLPPRPLKHVIYVDSSFFFPVLSENGYGEHSQSGRYTIQPERLLQAPIILPVGSKIRSLTIYYKNNTTELMPVAILKKHVNHHAPSGEVEVSLDNCPPGTLEPDNFLTKVIDHFENGGVIRDQYLYFIQIFNTAKIDDTQERTVRGMRIEYQY